MQSIATRIGGCVPRRSAAAEWNGAVSDVARRVSPCALLACPSRRFAHRRGDPTYESIEEPLGCRQGVCDSRREAREQSGRVPPSAGFARECALEVLDSRGWAEENEEHERESSGDVCPFTRVVAESNEDVDDLLGLAPESNGCACE
jgi:hypothetical protein